jgi:hypothetical protein
MQYNKQKALYAFGITGLVLVSAALWWGILNRNNKSSELVETPIVKVEPVEKVSPVLYPDPPKLAGHVLVGPKVPTKFYLARNGKRYVFPDDTKTYDTWKSVLPPINTVSQDELESYPLGGNVWYRPGTRLIRIQSDARIFAVAQGGVLRALNEGTAESLFGKDWKLQLDTLQDYYFTNYNPGEPILSLKDYNPQAETSKAATIEIDKGI